MERRCARYSVTDVDGVSYTGTTTLSFTATTDQPLDGGRSVGGDLREDHAGRDPVSGRVQLKNDIFQQVPAGRAGRELHPVTPQPWAICQAAAARR